MGWGVTFELSLPLAVVEVDIFVVHTQYLVTDELSAMLREGVGLLKTRRDLTLTPVAGLIFETKNRAIFLESFFREMNFCPEQLSRAKKNVARF